MSKYLQYWPYNIVNDSPLGFIAVVYIIKHQWLKKGPHDLFLRLSLVKLVLNTWWTWPKNRDEFKFVGQVHQVF